MELIHEGKAKKIFSDETSEENIIIEFTDRVTAGDGRKKKVIAGKGALTCDLTEYFMKYLSSKGIETHFVKRLEGPQIRCRKVEILPLEVVCRNLAAGSFCRRYGVKKGEEIQPPLVEFFLKDDILHDPLISEGAAIGLGLVSEDDIAFLKSITLSVNYYLSELFMQTKLNLVDFKLEFGKTPDGSILLADEISGDTIRVWNARKQSYDKDLFREGEGDIAKAYAFLLKTLNKVDQDKVAKRMEIVYVAVMPKDGIKNPPGEVTKKALLRLGFKDVAEVRMGKVFQIGISTPITSSILEQLILMNLKLLSNPIAEKHHMRMQM
ncbi:MAG: phosphoribosylaminoimidazolesuccinocarboxamide synthase [Candidatus Thorarchaeota archaeon]